jgi:hypothetical protein
MKELSEPTILSCGMLYGPPQRGSAQDDAFLLNDALLFTS